MPKAAVVIARNTIKGQIKVLSHSMHKKLSGARTTEDTHPDAKTLVYAYTNSRENNLRLCWNLYRLSMVRRHPPEKLSDRRPFGDFAAAFLLAARGV